MISTSMTQRLMVVTHYNGRDRMIVRKYHWMDSIKWNRGMLNSSPNVNCSFDHHRGEVSKFGVTFDLTSIT